MTSSAQLVERLGARVVQDLEAVVPRGSRVALLDFPNHRNVGDTAIYLGERAALRALECDVVHLASIASYSPRVVRRSLGRDGIVLLHGGGNFGDLWSTYQDARMAVIAEHTERRVVQLPQSVEFSDPGALERCVASLRRHPDLHVLVRDVLSASLLGDRLPPGTVSLTPDSAFALGSLTGPAPVQPEVLLLRTDHERKGEAAEDSVDWPFTDPATRRRWNVSRALGWPINHWHARPFSEPAARMFDHLAARRMIAGLDVLSRGSVVITDRLHGHIMSLLLGRPHVLLDNSYGKNRRFVDAWTSSCEDVRWAEDLPQARALAAELRPPQPG